MFAVEGWADYVGTPLPTGLRRSELLVSRVLIADDNAMIRKQIRNILELDGRVQVCAEAANGAEAVEKAQECGPDVAVMDVVMPVMDGLRATRRIKALMPGVRVLIFAFDSSKQLEWESKAAGADAILGKAEGSSRLAEVVQTLAKSV
jgi:DNA-binding NarL/FixJ family response regulator